MPDNSLWSKSHQLEDNKHFCTAKYAVFACERLVNESLWLSAEVCVFVDYNQ